MDSYKITIGFSNIKRILIEKCGLTIAPNELGLWFTCADDVVYAHSRKSHEACIAIAIAKNGRWSCRLKPYSFESNLFFYAVTLSGPGRAIQDVLNDLYKLDGFIPAGS